jgi:hypothetical protein
LMSARWPTGPGSTLPVAGCPNSLAQQAIQEAVGGHQNIDDLVVPSGRLLEQHAWKGAPYTSDDLAPTSESSPRSGPAAYDWKTV